MKTRAFKPLAPQPRRVLGALATGSTVSKVTAVHQRIGNIAEVIRQLRLRGWDIETVQRTDINGEKYTKYVLSIYQRDAALDATRFSRAS